MGDLSCLTSCNFLVALNTSQKIIITYSALIGGITHILLDLFYHKYVYILYPWLISPNFSFLFYSFIDFGLITL
ncbi:MAG: DUF4184 family protein [Promethearchaeota archaeon]